MKFIIACFALMALGLHGFVASASVGTRGGGNIHAAEFGDLAEQAIARISILKPVVISDFEIDGDKMRKVFDRAKVFAVKRTLTLNGRSVHAINDPSQLEIYFNESAWRRLNAGQKSQLVLHELLGLTFPEISDLNYAYSSELIRLLAKSVNRDLKVHCRLSAVSGETAEGYEVIDESMTWVRNDTEAQGALGDFNIQFALKASYIKITLMSAQNRKVIETNQYVGNNLDFESTVPFSLTISGKSYDTVQLMCEEALQSTP